MVRSSSVRRVAAVLALAAACAACSTTQAADDAADPPPTPRQRRGEVGEQEQAMGVNLMVMTIDPYTQSPTGFPRLVVAVRSENTTDVMTRNPQAELRCDEAPEGGDWYTGSTWEAAGLLPAGNVNEGQLYLGFPAKSGTQDDYAVATCTNAKLAFTFEKRADLQREVILYDVPQDVIQDAIAAEIGPALPLPNRALPASG